jgi:hypothetical protein
VRIYEGSPRQDFEEVLRSIGAFLDQRTMREVLLLEAPDGFIVQGLVTSEAGPSSAWSESMGSETKETLTFLDDDIARFMEEAVARRGKPTPDDTPAEAGKYEAAFRVIGRYLDEHKPHDIFFFEQSGAFVVRILTASGTGKHHTLVEFTEEDINALVSGGPDLRHKEPAGQAAPAPVPAAAPEVETEPAADAAPAS